MKELDELKFLLKEKLDFSDYEANAYLALVRSGKALTALEIVNESNVPKGRIYEIISNLEKRGALKGNNMRPAKYNAIHPRTVINNILRDRKSNLSELETIANEKIDRLEAGLEGGSFDTVPIEHIYDISQKLKELIEKCNEKIIGIGHDLSWLDQMPIKLALMRKLPSVKAKCIADLSGQTLNSGKELKRAGVDVRHIPHDKAPLVFLIVDGEEALILLDESKQVNGIYTKEKKIVKMLEEYFSLKYPNATPLEKLRGEKNGR